MSEASTDYQASTHAVKLAESSGIDLALVSGSGNDGLITKADVTRVIDRTKALSEPVVMPDEEGVGASALEHLPKMLEETIAAPPAPAPKIVVSSERDLLKLISDMRIELDALKDEQATLIDRDRYESDLTDGMYFLCRPNGLKWQEKRIRNKRTVLVDFLATAFIGPFKDKEVIEMYLSEKRSKREDSYIDWQNLAIRTGLEARRLDAQEKQERNSQFMDDISTNVLDRRVFKELSEHDDNVPRGQLIGPAA